MVEVKKEDRVLAATMECYVQTDEYDSSSPKALWAACHLRLHGDHCCVTAQESA